MKLVCNMFLSLVFMTYISATYCWTTEDLELFDLVESTSQNFYDVLGVDKKASASDIRKAYRRLSSLYHPDKNKNSDAEETFRKIAAIADVLRNEERRKTYDLVLATGLPDWRMPIYYYRRVRNMGLIELAVFLFFLATFAQYLFAWSVYWEKKYEIEEIVMSKLKKKFKHQKKGKSNKFDEAAIIEEEINSIPKPKCVDLFPVLLFCFFINIIKSSPSYLASCKEYFEAKIRPAEIEEESEEEQVTRFRTRKYVKPEIPDYTDITSNNSEKASIQNSLSQQINENETKKRKLGWDNLTESDIYDFKKALKKFPNGTLQRWEKIADFLNCSVTDVTSMVNQLKNQKVSKNVSLTLQGVTGKEKENFGSSLYEEKGKQSLVDYESSNTIKSCENNDSVNTNGNAISVPNGTHHSSDEKIWKQEEQKTLEIALQKFPKDIEARWDKIAEYVQTKSKEECVERYKILVQQIKKKKSKET